MFEITNAVTKFKNVGGLVVGGEHAQNLMEFSHRERDQTRVAEDKAREAERKRHEAEVAVMRVSMAEQVMSAPILLASAPIHCLEAAVVVTLHYGGEYSAGDATDKLNADILDPVCAQNNCLDTCAFYRELKGRPCLLLSILLQRNDEWKTAWKGKTSQGYRMLTRRCQDADIVAVAIKGGPVRTHTLVFRSSAAVAAFCS